MSMSRATELTLLNWVNTFPLDSEVTTVEGLSDGTVFAKMIGNICPDYATIDLQQNIGPSKWISNKRNLESVHKLLLRYIAEKCPNLDSLAFESKIDLNAIAEHGDSQETNKLLTMFLMAAVEGPKNRDYISLITTKLDTPAQEEIKTIIMRANATIRPSADTKESQKAPDKDNDLALEEAHANLFAEYEALKKKHADFMTRFERLTISHEDLIQYSNEADARLKALQDTGVGDHADHMKNQVERILELEDIIAAQEQQVEADRVLKEKQIRELISLRPMAALLTECQDELKVVKVENLNLIKKANKVDHYIKKLENHTSLQRENSELRERIDLLEDNQKDYDKVHEENTKYKLTATEYGSRFQEQELDIVELSSQRTALKQEIQILNERISELNERQRHDEKFINELQEQMRTSLGALSPVSAVPGQVGLSLEEELEQVEETPTHSLENVRLKAELKLLQNSIGNSKITQLNIELAQSERIKKQLEEKYQELLESHSVGQQQLNEILDNISGEKNESIIGTRKLFIEASQELITTKSKLAKLQVELSEREHELLEKKSSSETISDTEHDKIREIKGNNNTLASDLQAELLTLQDKYNTILADFKSQKKHLDHVKLMQYPDNDMALLTGEKLENAGSVQSLNNQNTQDEIFETNEHDKTIQPNEQKPKTLSKENVNILSLTSECQIKNLARENALIATAWYDLTNRIQSNHVVLQRRQEAPKSWLNKQRQMVDTTGRR
ncbi:BgTH12-01132 [Blumeria graminis f. sp. triticale]|uniref:BgTH12-01132 n=1 Tax=Blumeria graminis f. sp. triticale TaxID=1689686 RepID=A0A9W4GHH8_BLUGR|nr:BgTH12-01132 [Blumeria graminis f. sp. triticale]